MGLVTAWLTLLLSMVGALFWYNDWIYQLPTPVPKNYKPVAIGTQIDLGPKTAAGQHKPVFLHFYNPKCPCSRFNQSHFQSLVREYGQEIDFVVVVLSDQKYTAEKIQDKIGVDIDVIFDPSLAVRCGVYATPQAALLDREQKLYYRGNYNASRYCTDEKTAYAKNAIEALLKSQMLPIWSAKALKSYGCTMPVCKN
ncbi:TlpA family protein disulfide reductase [Dyadobacter pollutisoli]|uniref:Thioredoxin fold domain-containing protein n=1 Tax=Dyadobacter pollutisoli TaxID=2910158 RepID=A0A9E8NFI6_9BACT|nr:thioredoxin fold domain-containing protein [Dyadobacter pollutisoli]WAC13179.1 thioredoxin fold domain-containing protein [Dyadobacter pollutisoli]